MDTVPNPAPAGAEVHFPYAHLWSCGATFGQETSTDPAAVTCRVCLQEMRAPADPSRDDPSRDDPESGQPIPAEVEGYPVTGRRSADLAAEELAQRVRTAIEVGAWDDMLRAAQELYAHEVGRIEGTAGGAR